jgi:transposase
MKQLAVTCGLDVHKDNIFAALYNGKKCTEVQKFSTFTCGLRQLTDWLFLQNVNHVALESTGVYWVPTWNFLESAGFKVMLINPWFIKQMPGRKRDVADAQWIAMLLHKGLLRGSLIPSPRIRELRSYSRTYVQLQYQVTRVLQQMNKVLELCNIRINTVMTKMDSVSSINIIRTIVSGVYDTQSLVEQVNKAVLTRKRQLVEQSLEGTVREDQRFLLQISLQQYDLLTDQLQQIEEHMTQHCQTYFARQMELLQSIPGIRTQAAMQIIAETGADMQYFRDSTAISSWAGLRPRNDESNGKIKNNHITRGNKYLRRILVQTGWGATRTKGSYFKFKYEQLCKRMNSKKALIAIARKQLTVIWNVLYKEEKYNSAYQPIYTPEKLESQLKYHQQMINKLSKLN